VADVEVFSELKSASTPDIKKATAMSGFLLLISFCYKTNT
jgi:hypothetical protein